LVAIILTNKKVRHNFNLEFAAEGVAREMLKDAVNFGTQHAVANPRVLPR
jgi:hypothetical protein